jgi:UDP-N-acetyl-D-glucosamine dehydrogenase
VPYYPGPGIGGHCIPVDPFYLTWKAREYGLHTRFIELAGEVNGGMPDYVIARLAKALNDREKSIKASKVLLLGMAYKKNVDDMRESPSLEIYLKLQDLGANVDFHDPHIPKLPSLRKHPTMRTESVSIDAKSLGGYDVVIMLTEHDAFDLDEIQAHSSLIVDTRGAFDQNAANVVRA